MNKTKLILIGSFLVIFLSSCQPIDYDRGDRPRDTKNSDDDGIGIEKFELETLIEEVENLDDAKKQVSNAFAGCADHKTKTPSLRLISDGLFSLIGNGSNPFRAVENCFSKAVETSVKPLCDYEARLDELEEEHKDDNRALDRIDEARYQVEDTKDQVIDQLYNLADEMDEGVAKLHDRNDDKINDDFFNSLLGFVIESELSSLTQHLESEANLVCSDNLINFDKYER